MRNYLISLGIILILLGAFALPATAQLSQNCRSAQGGYCIGLAEIYVPGLEFLKVPNNAEIGEFLGAVYYFLIGVVGLSAFIAFTVGGVMYLFSAGSEKMTSQGRVWMWNAVYGLAIAMISWLVLYTINPDLVLQLNLQIQPIRGTIQGQKLEKTHAACVDGTCKAVTGEGSDNCSVCGGLPPGCLNPASRMTYCYNPSTQKCTATLASLCKTPKVPKGLCPSSC